MNGLGHGRCHSTTLKCIAINFDKVTPVVQYKLGTICLAWTKNTKYLGVTLQSDLTFNLHIAEKSIKFN